MASAKSKSKQEEALALLNDLDSLNTQPSSAGAAQSSSSNTAAPAGSASTGAPSQGEDVLAFLDEITQKSSEPTRSSTPRSATPTLRKSTERVRVGISAGPMRSSLSSDGTGSLTAPMMRSSLSTASSTTAGDVAPEPPAPAAAAAAAPAQSGGWGWGNVWSSASAALQQARTVVDEQVKQARTVVDERVGQSEQAKRMLEYAQARGGTVLEYAKNAQLDKLGQDFKRVGLSTLTDILNVVAPPISEHEVIQIWLSYDMRGYEGIESLTYRSLSTLMEQVEGGDLVLNRGGPESRPKGDNSGVRELNAVEGYDAALKLSQANLQDLIKHVTSTSATPSNTSSIKNPTTYSDVYLRIQAYTSSLTLPAPPSLPTTSSQPAQPSSPPQQQQQQQQQQPTLHFLLDLSDPGHALQFTTTTQPVPAAWIEVWDDAGNEWVEDLVAEALRVGVEVVGQQYLAARMGWGQKKKTAPVKDEEGVGAASGVKGKEVKGAEEEEEEDEEDEEEDEEEEEEEESVDEDGVVVEKE